MNCSQICDKLNMMKEGYTIGIQLKRYARKYMIEFYGEPVNLYASDWKDLLNKIIDCLEKPKTDREKECKMKGYIETRFVISQRDFYRGFSMSKTDTVRINKRVEDKIKWISRHYIYESIVRGERINAAIREFQEKYNLHEDEMSYDLIYKDFLRSRRNLKSDPLFKKFT